MQERRDRVRAQPSELKRCHAQRPTYLGLTLGFKKSDPGWWFAANLKMQGVARILMPDELDIESARQGLTIILSESSYRERPAAVRDEIAAMPTADDVAAALSPATR
jgi:hypothetical protein